jgi:hypothetical protein
MVKARPAMVALAVRGAPVLSATSICTVPAPLPVAGDTDTHVAVVPAVQPHPDGVVTSTLRELAAAGTASVSGVIEAVQPLPCVIVNVWPPTPIVPLRAEPVFAAAVKVRVAGPLPVAGVTAIHAVSLDAAQAHAPSVVSANDPDPPLAGTFCEEEESE